MVHTTVTGRRISGTTQRALYWCLNVAVAQAFMACAYTQYLFDPSNADEQPGIRYFGSAKDEKGVLMAGVTVFIEYGSSNSFVFVTDDQGRFRGSLPLTQLSPDKISSRCSKPGYQLVKATKRPGLDAPKPYVQVDCVLRAAAG